MFRYLRLRHFIFSAFFPGLCFFCSLFMALGYFTPQAQAMGEGIHNYMVGFRTIGGTGESGELISVAVWHPTQRPRRSDYSIKAGAVKIRAERNVPPAQGLFPVILFSHDMVRNGLEAHDLCSNLAEAGFVVIAPTHFGDNDTGAGALHSAALYYHRSRQVLDALAVVAATPEFKKIINLQRVGVLGSGNGAVTALQLAGVDLDAQGAMRHCAANPDDQVFCGRWAAARYSLLPRDAAEIRTKHGKNAFKPILPHIRAVALMAPGGLFMLEQQELARLQIPLAAVFAENDELYPAPADAQELQELFAPPLIYSLSRMTLDGMDHYSLSAPCTGEQLAAQPGLCGSAGADDREEAARQRDRYFITFFRSSLGVPVSPDQP